MLYEHNSWTKLILNIIKIKAILSYFLKGNGFWSIFLFQLDCGNGFFFQWTIDFDKDPT